MIFLTTPRLVLRNVEPGDADAMFDYRNHELCYRYQRDQTRDRGGIEALVRRRSRNPLNPQKALPQRGNAFWVCNTRIKPASLPTSPIGA